MKLTGTLVDVYQSGCLDPAHLCMLHAFALSGASLSLSFAHSHRSPVFAQSVVTVTVEAGNLTRLVAPRNPHSMDGSSVQLIEIPAACHA